MYTQNERLEIVSSIKWVDAVFLEDSLEKKREYLAAYGADVLVMGSDWAGIFDMFSDSCNIVYVDRTPSISTTEVIEKIRG
ncbi:hypothetical protein GCM10022414_34480 [Zhongshania borealis]|uniref:Cytidyltransferase-like domain-containing protein n=1 Tax=Zhongshania borealis TaxID=889488 RepID=A0ABP7X5U1_9GAMM